MIVPDPAICAVETTTTTTTTTIEETTTEETTAEEEVDLTEFFHEQKELDHLGVTYKCCCSGDHDAETIACEMKDTDGPKKISYKGGCGGLSGDGYHSWSNMPGKYASYEGYGRCVVKRE